MEALFATAKYWKQSNCPYAEECLNKVWYIHTMEYYAIVKINEEDLYELTWNDFQNMLHGENRSTKKYL